MTASTAAGDRQEMELELKRSDSDSSRQILDESSRKGQSASLARAPFFRLPYRPQVCVNPSHPASPLSSFHFDETFHSQTFPLSHLTANCIPPALIQLLPRSSDKNRYGIFSFRKASPNQCSISPFACPRSIPSRSMRPSSGRSDLGRQDVRSNEGVPGRGRTRRGRESEARCPLIQISSTRTDEDGVAV